MCCRQWKSINCHLLNAIWSIIPCEAVWGTLPILSTALVWLMCAALLQKSPPLRKGRNAPATGRREQHDPSAGNNDPGMILSLDQVGHSHSSYSSMSFTYSGRRLMGDLWPCMTATCGLHALKTAAFAEPSDATLHDRKSQDAVPGIPLLLSFQ